MDTSVDGKSEAQAKGDESKDKKSKEKDGSGFVVDIEGITAEDLKQHPVIDKILGVIYGNCLGDAVGLSTEFMSKKEVVAMYGKKPIPFPDFERNFHNSRWASGDWTDDSDQMILIMDTIAETQGQVAEALFAKKLFTWIRRGFPELGDFGGMGLGMTVANTCAHPAFLTDPHRAAYETWIRLNKDAAANGAVMRTSILGCYQYDDLSKVISNTERIAKVTHHDPRCVASCIAVTTLIALILQGKPHATPEEREALAQEALKLCKDVPFESAEHKAEFVRHLNVKKIDELKLDEPKAIGYTFKCFGCGFYGLRSQKDFKSTLREVAVEAGDADTNGAVCGAVMGARLGYSGLPHDWIKAMPHKKWLDKKVVAFLKVMKLLKS